MYRSPKVLDSNNRIKLPRPARPSRLGTPLATQPSIMKIRTTDNDPLARKAPSHAPALRLVNTQGLALATVLRVSHNTNPAPDLNFGPDPAVSAQRRANRVATENQAAAGLSALDPRWIFAVQVAKNIEGGRAAILIPERRHKLLIIATSLGLRPFDANLVIAVVQDGARSGEGSLSNEAEDRLKLIRPADQPHSRRQRFSESTLNLIVSGTTVVVAVGIFFTALAWLQGS